MDNIEKIQTQIEKTMQQIDSETLLENQMAVESFEITNMLYKNQTCCYVLNHFNLEIRFTRQLIDNQQGLMLYVFDLDKLALAMTQYRPASFSLILNRDKSEYENLKDLVYTMVCYHHDAIKPEELD